MPRLLTILDRRPEAAYEIGRTLAALVPDDDETRDRLLTLVAAGTQGALVGYLQALVGGGTSDAFDQLLDSASSSILSDFTRLQVSVSGPQSGARWARVSRLVRRLKPGDAARGLLGWHIDLDAERLRGFLSERLPRIQTQDDYEAVVDFVDLAVHRSPGWIDSVDPLIADLVALRPQFVAPLVTMRKEWLGGSSRAVSSRCNPPSC